MGFERLVRVLQGKQSNYDTDVFTGTISEVEKITGRKYDYSDSKEAIAFRVIADHIRAIAFTISDGQLPSNTGAGYVIRRILRRAVRYYYSYLDYKQPLLYQLTLLLAHQFENVFPELKIQSGFISKVIKEEEDAFLKTLDKGLLRFEMFMSLEGLKMFQEGKKEAFILPGKIAFELNDTYGFPIDLTRLIAKEKGLTVDEAGFEIELQQQKQRSRAATVIDTEDWVEIHKNGSTKFIGYTDLETKTRVARYRKIKSKGKESFQLVLETTPFYAESGGQVGDTGTLQFGNEVIDVQDTKKENELIIHFTQKIPALIDEDVWAKVDSVKRKNIAIHHSATHLLHAALRKVLGNHVAQKGSLVNDEHLRFDFSHFAKVGEEEMEKIEQLVNEKIRENIPVIIKEMPKDEAIRMGAMALFGEKYGDRVRVVIIDPEYSIELCGGTHVGATGEIGFFKIKHETAVAAGVRRIEAVAGKISEDFVQEQFSSIRSIREYLKNPADILKSVENIATENNELKKKIESLEAKQLNGLKNELLQKGSAVHDISFIGDQVEVNSADALKKLGFDLRTDLKKYVIVLTADISGKAAIVIMIDDQTAAAKNLDASKIIKEHIAPLIKGGGGGQKTLATAGGQDTGKLREAIEKVKSLLE